MYSFFSMPSDALSTPVGEFPQSVRVALTTIRKMHRAGPYELADPIGIGPMQAYGLPRAGRGERQAQLT